MTSAMMTTINIFLRLNLWTAFIITITIATIMAYRPGRFLFFNCRLDIIKISMSKNPLVNAFSAAAYIFLVVTVMNFVTQPLRNKPDTFFAPITVLFVLTLSVAVMAFLFFYQPLMLFIEGKKKDAVNLFAKTVGIFVGMTVAVLILLFSGLI